MPAKQEPRERSSPTAGYPIGKPVLTFLAMLAVLLALWIVVRLKTVVVLALIAVVLTAGLAPAVIWLENRCLPRNRRLPRVLAIMIVFIIGFVVVSGAFTLILVPLVQQAIEFSKHLPEYLDTLEKWLGGLHDRYPQVPDYAHVVAKAQSQLSQAGRYIAGSAGAVFGFFGGVASVFTVLVFTFYLLLTFEDIRRNVMQLVPSRDHQKARAVLGKMAQAMGGWLRGMILLSLIVGTTTSVAMLALGVPYAYVIGIAGAIGEPIPMVGPLVAAILGILIAAFGPTWKLIVAVIFFIVLAVVESNILAPKIMQRQVGLSPLTTIAALASGAALLGIVGAVLAVPVAAALRVLYYEVVVPAVKRAQATPEVE